MAPRLRGACTAVLVASLASACGGGEGATSQARPAGGATGAAVPVVVDTDLAVDDLVALAFLLSSTEAEVRAVTVSGTGEVRCPQGLRVIRSLLSVTGDEGVPVACGRSTPLAGDHAFPTEWRELADSGWGLDLSTGPMPATDLSATDLLGTTLRQGGVTVLTLGPLTNVAEAFRADPELAAQVASIVVMGGALDVPGNVPGNVAGEGTGSSTAEWNVYVDPTAAAEVLASGAPIVLVGLDATDQLPITGDFLELLGANTRTGPAKLVDGLIRNNPQVYSGEAYFWDPLAAAVVVEPELVTTEEAAISVLTTPGVDDGRTVRAPDGARPGRHTGDDRPSPGCHRVPRAAPAHPRPGGAARPPREPATSGGACGDPVRRQHLQLRRAGDGAQRAHAVHLPDDRPAVDGRGGEPDRGAEHRGDPRLGRGAPRQPWHGAGRHPGDAGATRVCHVHRRRRPPHRGGLLLGQARSAPCGNRHRRVTTVVE